MFWLLVWLPIVWYAIIPPILFYGNEGSLIQYGPDQWIHLGHVATEPEQPAAYTNQHQYHLYYTPVRIFGYKYWQYSANDSKNSSKKDNR